MTSNNADLSMQPSRRRRNQVAADAVQADVQQEEHRQLNVAVPVQMHRQIRVRAAQEGITVREWCMRALEISLELGGGSDT